jgi:hypothetical protein
MTFLRPSNIEEMSKRIVANQHQKRQNITVLDLTILRIGIIGVFELSDEK